MILVTLGLGLGEPCIGIHLFAASAGVAFSPSDEWEIGAHPNVPAVTRLKLAMAIDLQRAHVPLMFDYDAAAELFFGHPGVRARSRVGYRRFTHASRAVLFAVEELAPAVLNSTFLEVNEDRFNAADIRSLYEHADFPLARKAGR